MSGDVDLFDKPVANDPRARLTERDMLDRLSERYGRLYANGPSATLRYVGARHVRFGPLWPSCIADFLAQDCWGNYGTEEQRHPLLGFEVKVSRSDYLREIKDLGKSEPFRRVCTEWYMVVSEPKIVRDDLPDGWGLLIAQGDGLRCVRKSATNPSPEPMPRGLIAGFLRAVAMQARGGEPWTPPTDAGVDEVMVLAQRAQDASNGDSNDEEIELLREALEAALTLLGRTLPEPNESEED